MREMLSKHWSGLRVSFLAIMAMASIPFVPANGFAEDASVPDKISHDICPKGDSLIRVPPSTPRELLLTIHNYVEKSLFLTTQLYRDNNLQILFSSSSVDFVSKTDREYAIRVDHMGELFQKSEKFPGLGVDIRVRFAVNSKGEALAGACGGSQVNFGSATVDTGHDSRLTADVVEQIFGTKFSLTNLYDADESKIPPRASIPLQRAVHPLGNRAMQYAIVQDGGVNSTLIFNIGYDGVVDSFSISQNSGIW